MVANPSNLEKDFSSMLTESLRKQVAAVALRIWTPKGADILDLTQIQEEEAPLPLTGTRVRIDDQTSEYQTGSWEDESRDFYLGVRVPVGELDEERLGARVSLMVDGEQAGQALVRTVWTDDVAKSTRMNRRVARAMNEEELAVLIQDVVDSHRAGDVRQATDRAEDAWRIAEAEGNDGVKERIATMFDEDPLTGRLRPKVKVDEAAVMDLEAKSTKTTSREAGAPEPSDDAYHLSQRSRVSGGGLLRRMWRGHRESARRGSRRDVGLPKLWLAAGLGDPVRRLRIRARCGRHRRPLDVTAVGGGGTP